jgi:hypothetical protein
LLPQSAYTQQPMGLCLQLFWHWLLLAVAGWLWLNPQAVVFCDAPKSKIKKGPSTICD